MLKWIEILDVGIADELPCVIDFNSLDPNGADVWYGESEYATAYLIGLDGCDVLHWALEVEFGVDAGDGVFEESVFGVEDVDGVAWRGAVEFD